MLQKLCLSPSIVCVQVAGVKPQNTDWSERQCSDIDFSVRVQMKKMSSTFMVLSIEMHETDWIDVKFCL